MPDLSELVGFHDMCIALVLILLRQLRQLLGYMLFEKSGSKLQPVNFLDWRRKHCRF